MGVFPIIIIGIVADFKVALMFAALPIAFNIESDLNNPGFP
jgi:hypothetical protein